MLVPPPLTKFLTQPSLLFAWLVVRLRRSLTDLRAEFGVRIMSKAKLLSRARYKTRRGQVVAAARAVHVAFSEAFATGDVAALRRTTDDTLFEQLSHAVARRPRGRRYAWHLVRYNGAARLVDLKIQPLQMAEDAPPIGMMRQAVVRIPSRQRLVEYDDTQGGKVVSDKEVDIVEYLLISASVDIATFVTSDWIVKGTVEEMDLAQAKRRQKAVAEMEKGTTL
jgi:hypothetical protein